MTKKARVILIDKPQPYRNRHEARHDGSSTRFGIGVASRYTHGVMTEEALRDLGPLIRSIAAEDALIFHWVTKPNMPFDMKLLEAWGLEYKTTPFVWVKRNKNQDTTFCGAGAYNFSNVEEVWLARYPGSKLWFPNNPAYKPRQVLQEDWNHTMEVYEAHPRGENGKIIHSRKPEAIQDMIDAWLGPYLDGHTRVELFATRERPGWVCLGGDLSGNDIRTDLTRLAEGAPAPQDSFEPEGDFLKALEHIHRQSFQTRS